METWTPKSGQLLDAHEFRRDAIHIALAPVTAACRLIPGQSIGFSEEGNVELVGAHDHDREKCIGIVDPFLTAPVEQGQRFWMFLYPNTITGLRHVWQHPAFTQATQQMRAKLAVEVRT